MQPPKSYSVSIILNCSDPDAYWATLTLASSGVEPFQRDIRLDNMYEQVQHLVDNKLREICNKLSTEMREARKNNKGQ